MKTKLLILLCMMMNFTFAGDPVPGDEPDDEVEAVTVRLDLNLYIEKECRGNTPFCSISSKLTLGGTEVILQAKGDGYPMCGTTSDGTTSCQNVYDYRGLWSTVVEKDGIRALAIVSIDRYTVEIAGDGVYQYTITVELLDNDGLSAKMKVSTNDPKKLNSSTLMGRVVNFQGEKYTPQFSLAAPICWVDQSGEPVCDIVDEDDIRDPDSKNQTDINVILGHLK
jgi:hypothetical protein